MANLKADLQCLAEIFPENHPIFRITSSFNNVDEISCVFVVVNKDGTKETNVINAIIPETYPNDPPVWFANSDVVSIALQALANTTGKDNFILRQVAILLEQLCSYFAIQCPQAELKRLNGLGGERTNSGTTSSGQAIVPKEQPEPENRLLTLINNRSKNNNPNGNNRLLKELKNVCHCDSFRHKVFNVELVNDNFYEWNVYLMVVDQDSQLYGDLQILKQKEGRDSIQLNVLFKETFPFEPPFVRVVYPTISGGFVMSGGAICLELLTTQGWSSVYTMEAIILQISSALVKGNARINFSGNKEQYSLASAQQSFMSLMKSHERTGWYTPPSKEG